MDNQMETLTMPEGVKVQRVTDIIAGLKSVVVAYSGGVDSSLLLALCLRVLGQHQVLAVTADSATLPRSEMASAAALAQELGARRVRVPSRELEDPSFTANASDRCYHCKKELFRQLWALARAEGHRAVVYGATAEDLGDHRPGMEAAREAGAVAPLLDAGFTKADVRALSRELGLRTWDKPAMACLSSRFPYGERITEAKLSQVEAAEDLLRRQLGFRQVRVRHHGTIARIEVDPSEIGWLLSEPIRSDVLASLKDLGYAYVTVDLQGFRSGSLNEAPTDTACAADPRKTSVITESRGGAL